ncbi:MAG: phosphoribosyltransferase family protein [Acidimicrobiales bacterium]
MDDRERDEHLLDAFLLAAGLNQVLEDYLDRDVLSLGAFARWLTEVDGTLLRSAGRAVAATAVTRERLGGLLAPALALRRYQRAVAALVDELADSLSTPEHHGVNRIRTLRGPLMMGRSVKAETNLPPSCFRSFDQRPDDLRRLADRFVAQDLQGSRVVVVGIRTSGSYLAPLCAAFLRRHDITATSATLRLGRPVSTSLRAQIGDRAVPPATFLLVDDPPRTGTALCRAIRELMAVGCPSERMRIMVALDQETNTLPEQLRRLDHTVITWDEWAAHDDIDSAWRSIPELLPGQEIPEFGRIERVEHVGSPRPLGHRRGRVRARFSATVEGTNGSGTLDLCVEGVGLGYLGRDTLAASRRLASSGPELLGFGRGLVIREWLPESSRLSTREIEDDPIAFAKGVTAHILARARALATPADKSRALRGRSPVWRKVVALMPPVVGRFDPFVRILIRALILRILNVDSPTVIDGDMDANDWFTGSTPEPAFRRITSIGITFSNKDVSCYDPVYDLAGVASVGLTTPPAVGDRLRECYELATGQDVGGARWWLYQLLHLVRQRDDLLRKVASAEGRVALRKLLETEQGMSAAMRRLHQELVGRPHVSAREHAGIAVLDVDGVLETRWLGVPAPTPAAIKALSALRSHGYTTLLATGRSLEDAVRRCSDYGLSGAVAEYGAAIYDRHQDRNTSLLQPSDACIVRDLRLSLGRAPGMYVDPSYGNIVRCYQVRRGRLQGLDAAAVSALLNSGSFAGRFRVISTSTQTDFVPVNVNKAEGVRALLADMSLGTTVSLAVGDTEEDRCVLDMAERAFVPAGADMKVSSPIVRLAQHSQSAVEVAVSQVLGHPPGGCSHCALPRADLDNRLLMSLFEASSTDRWGRLWSVLRLATGLAMGNRGALAERRAVG